MYPYIVKNREFISVSLHPIQFIGFILIFFFIFIIFCSNRKKPNFHYLQYILSVPPCCICPTPSSVNNLGSVTLHLMPGYPPVWMPSSLMWQTLIHLTWTLSPYIGSETCVTTVVIQHWFPLYTQHFLIWCQDSLLFTS